MILIVDDNQLNIFSLKKLLELNKFTVDTALSGEAALKNILKNDYSLIILDVQMPDMDGFEVAEAISGYSKSKDIPIIFLSAINTHKKYITKGYDSGGVDYVTKPFDPDILLMKIKTFYRLSEQKRKLVEMDQFLREEIEYRKKAESDLEQKVEELKSTLESMPQIAFTTCPDGKIEFVNNHWMLYSDNEKQFPTTEGISVSDCMTMAIASGKQYIQEVKLKRLKESGYRFHVFYLTPVRKQGVLVKWVGILTDIHEQKMASQVLERKVTERTLELKQMNQQLEDRNIELQQFAFVASHDLQEPLRKIEIYTNLVNRDLSGEGNDVSRHLDKILSSAGRMRKLITDVLEYSKLPAAELFKIADINEILNEALQDFELKIKDKKAVIHIGKIPTLEVIPGQMRQIFQNLISNSLKFSKPDVQPEIKIHADLILHKAIDSSIDRSGEYCRISVCDNGIGFDQKYGEKIFEIFQRLNERNAYEGTGIGLAIVKKIIDRHNGLISVKSHSHEGACFTMVLPVRQNNSMNSLIDVDRLQ